MAVFARRVLTTMVLLSTLGIAACDSSSGDSPTDPPAPPADALAAYRQQAMAWQPCSPTLFSSQELNILAALGESRVQCATLRAPLDYQAPEAGQDIQVAVLRVAAVRPDQRQGAILFNPGGPGGDGLTTPLPTARLFSLGNPDSPLGKTLLQLQDQYDLIGFSPRGVGGSTPLICISNEAMRPAPMDIDLYTPAVGDNMLRNARAAAEACQAQPLARHIHTEAVAQDLDLLRSVLGDSKLNYLGYSYGTWLGAWYASRFPERVGRFVLDSNMDFTADFQAAVLDVPISNTRTYDQALAPYAARHPDIFQLGTADDVRQLMRGGLRPAIREIVRQELGLSQRGDAFEHNLHILRGASATEAVLAAHAGANPETLRTLLENYAYSPDPDVQREARNFALYLLQRLNQPAAAPELVRLDARAAVFRTVQCNDTPLRDKDPAFWVQQHTRLAQAAPILPEPIAQQVCLYWNWPTADRPPTQALAPLDILMVQAQLDGSTGLDGALRAFSQLPKASLAYVPDEVAHGVFPYDDQCVDALVAQHLAGTSATQRETTCPAHPFNRDRAAAEGGQARAASSAEATPTYRQQELAREMMDLMHRKINPRPLGLQAP